MSLLMKEVVDKAFNLSPKEGAELAHELILSLDESKESKIERAWDKEIKKRVDEIKSGKAKGGPAENILAEIRAKYS